MLTQLLLLLVITLPVPILCMVFTGYQITRAPEETPERILENGRPNGTLIACIGDSITQGRVGFDWVGLLRQRMPDHHFMNAGKNGHVTWQVNQRIEPILDCKPNIAIVPIGTNDAMASHDSDWGRHYQRYNRLEVPTLAAFTTEVEGLLDRLAGIPHVAICTLPPLGEFPRAAINNHLEAFNKAIRSAAKKRKVTVIPVSKTLKNLMAAREKSAVHPFPASYSAMVRGMLSACFQHYVFGTPWDRYGRQQGNIALFDHIHLGERAGEHLADLVGRFVTEKTTS